jgi:hypothetical protein
VKEIIIKRGASTVVKLPFDQRIIDDFDAMKERAADQHVSIIVTGTGSNIPSRSIIANVISTGSKGKIDKKSGEPVLWIQMQVVETNHDRYSAGMILWVKFSMSVLASLGCDIIEKARPLLVGKKLLIGNIGLPKRKESEDMSFVFEFGSVAIAR